jgi:hypothetical protein
VNSAALQEDSVTGAKLGNVVLRTDSVCATGERMLTGGAYWGGNPDADAADLHLVLSHPYGATGRTARAYDGTGGNRTLYVRVMCLD